MQSKENKLTRPAAASLSYTATAVIGKAAAFLTLPFFTAHLGAQAYGRYALYLCYEGLLFSAVSLGLGGAAVYRALSRFRGEENRLLTAALFLSLCAALLLFPVSALFLQKKLIAPWIFALFVQVLSRLAFTLYAAKCRHLYHYRRLCAMNLLCDLGSPLLGVLLLLLFPIGEGARILGGAIAAAAVGLFSLVALLHGKRKRFDKEAARYLLGLQLPLLPHYLSMAVMAEVGRLAVERVLGSEALGAYAVAHSVGFALTLITGSLSGAFQPWVLRKLRAGEAARVAEVAERLALLLCTAAVLPVLAAPEIFSLLAPQAYAIGANAVPALSFTAVLTFLSSVPVLAKLGADAKRSISAVSLVAALTCSLLCPLLSRSFGLYGCALGVLISYLVFYAFHSITLKKETRCAINAKNCFLIVLSFSLVALALPLLYPQKLLRVLLGILYLLCALVQGIFLLPSLLEGRVPKQNGGARRAA